MQKEPTFHDLLERMQIIIEHSNELFYIHDTNHISLLCEPHIHKDPGIHA